MKVYSTLKLVRPNDANRLLQDAYDFELKIEEYKKFEVAKITFLVASALPLYLTGLYSGIVIDAGFLHTTMSPIYEGFSLLHMAGPIGYGGLDISVALLKEILAENPSITKQSAFIVTVHTPEWLEEVKVRIGRILPLLNNNVEKM